MNSLIESGIELLETRIAPAGLVFASGQGVVNIFTDGDADNDYADLTDSFSPFANYTGAINVAAGDFDGDGNDELVVSQATGLALVKIYDLLAGGVAGAVLEKFAPFGLPIKGASVATGDINNDGRDELIVGAGPGGAPTVKIYNDANSDGTVSDVEVDSFLAFASTFKGGVKVASGNTNNAGGTEVVAGMASKGGSVSIFASADGDAVISDETTPQLETFQPFGASYKKGVSVAAGILSSLGNGGAEVIVGNVKVTPMILIYGDAAPGNNGLVFDDPVLDTILPGGPGFKKGANVAAGDTDLSGIFVEIITAPTNASGSAVKIYDDGADAGALLSDELPVSNVNAFTGTYSSGVNVAFGKVLNADFASRAPASIPDNGTLNNSIFVPANTGLVKTVRVDLAIAHTFDGDLDVTLTNLATGVSVVLFTDVGGSGDGFIIRLADGFTDIGTVTGTDGSAITGSFAPEGGAVLSAFAGASAAGEWRLRITDDAVNDVGTLFSWSLHFGV